MNSFNPASGKCYIIVEATTKSIFIFASIPQMVSTITSAFEQKERGTQFESFQYRKR